MERRIRFWLPVALLVAALAGSAVADDPVVLRVKIVVDEDQPAAREVWEARLRRRVQEASRVLESTVGVRLRVVELAAWQSDDALQDFADSRRELQREVRRPEGGIVLGFTSQYEFSGQPPDSNPRDAVLRPHLLIPEGTRRVDEAERLALLLHELGHFFGAVDREERSSVMRSTPANPAARAAGYKPRFDPANAKLMVLVAKEIRQHGLLRGPDLSAATRARLKGAYAAAAPHPPRQTEPPAPPTANVNPVRPAPQTSSTASRRKKGEPLLPDDPVVARSTRIANAPELADGTRRVLRAIESAAAKPDRRPLRGEETDEQASRIVRAAAAAARDLPPRDAPMAMLLGLGVALGDRPSLLRPPHTRQFFLALPPAAATQREPHEKRPTIRGSSEAVRIFFDAACRTVIGGPEAAQAAGYVREMADARGEAGFSFADLGVSYAGVRFANAVLDGTLPIEQIAEDPFSLSDQVPDFSDLPGGMSTETLHQKFGQRTGLPFRWQINRIERRLRSGVRPSNSPK